MRCAQLASRVAAPLGAVQPLAVQQVRAGQIDGGTAAPELADRLGAAFLRCPGSRWRHLTETPAARPRVAAYRNKARRCFTEDSRLSALVSYRKSV